MISIGDSSAKVDSIFYAILLDFKRLELTVKYKRKDFYTHRLGKLTRTDFEFESQEDLNFYRLVGKFKHKKNSLFRFKVKEQHEI